MKTSLIKRPAIQLVGLSVRTSNKQESDAATAKIGPLFHTYTRQNWAERIPNRVTPGVTYSAYTNYTANGSVFDLIDGEYTYFLGEAVSHATNIPEGLSSHLIPAQTYMVFTAGPGLMPDICIQTWQHIWQQPDLPRAYLTDFEVYEERAQDPSQAVLDIYVGLQPQGDL